MRTSARDTFRGVVTAFRKEQASTEVDLLTSPGRRLLHPPGP
jgi:hypothetical protein